MSSLAHASVMQANTFYKQQARGFETSPRSNSSQATGAPRPPVSRIATNAKWARTQANTARSVQQGDCAGTYRATTIGNTEQQKEEDEENDGNYTATYRAFTVDDDDDDPDSPFEATVTHRQFWGNVQDRLSESDEKEVPIDDLDERGSATRLWGDVTVNGKRLPTHAIGTRPSKLTTFVTGLNVVERTVNDRSTEACGK